MMLNPSPPPVPSETHPFVQRVGDVARRIWRWQEAFQRELELGGPAPGAAADALDALLGETRFGPPEVRRVGDEDDLAELPAL